MKCGKYIVLVKNKTESTDLQSRLFELGYKWAGDGIEPILFYPPVPLYYLVFKNINSDKTILFGTYEDENQAIKYRDFIYNFDKYIKAGKSRSVNSLKEKEIKEICNILKIKCGEFKINKTNISIHSNNKNALFEEKTTIDFSSSRVLAVIKTKECIWGKTKFSSKSSGSAKGNINLMGYLAKLNI